MGNFKVYNNKIGSQWIDVTELENSDVIQSDVKRLYEGFIAEQQSRASIQGDLPDQPTTTESVLGKAKASEAKDSQLLKSNEIPAENQKKRKAQGQTRDDNESEA